MEVYWKKFRELSNGILEQIPGGTFEGTLEASIVIL